MRKMTVKPRKSGLRAPIVEDGIEYNDFRRLRNAMRALVEMDARWIWWVEKNIPVRENLRWKRRMIERRARFLLANRYRFLGKGFQNEIVYSDLYFTDDGSLKTYL